MLHAFKRIKSVRGNTREWTWNFSGELKALKVPQALSSVSLMPEIYFAGPDLCERGPISGAS